MAVPSEQFLTNRFHLPLFAYKHSRSELRQKEVRLINLPPNPLENKRVFFIQLRPVRPDIVGQYILVDYFWLLDV